MGFAGEEDAPARPGSLTQAFRSLWADPSPDEDLLDRILSPFAAELGNTIGCHAAGAPISG
jgi:hypothetical protein